MPALSVAVVTCPIATVDAAVVAIPSAMLLVVETVLVPAGIAMLLEVIVAGSFVETATSLMEEILLAMSVLFVVLSVLKLAVVTLPIAEIVGVVAVAAAPIGSEIVAPSRMVTVTVTYSVIVLVTPSTVTVVTAIEILEDRETLVMVGADIELPSPGVEDGRVRVSAPGWPVFAADDEDTGIPSVAVGTAVLNVPEAIGAVSVVDATTVKLLSVCPVMVIKSAELMTVIPWESVNMPPLLTTALVNPREEALRLISMSLDKMAERLRLTADVSAPLGVASCTAVEVNTGATTEEDACPSVVSVEKVVLTGQISCGEDSGPKEMGLQPGMPARRPRAGSAKTDGSSGQVLGKLRSSEVARSGHAEG